MAKMSKEELARYEGADWMLRTIDAKGLDEAKAELDRRNARGIPLGLNRADVSRFVDSEKLNLMNCFMLMAISVLHDEFDFDKETIDRYIERFNNKAACLGEGYVKWQDLQQIIAEETGIKVQFSEG